MKFESPTLNCTAPLLVALLLLGAPVAGWAHDPYEISATACLYSNRVELVVVMEFRTGMRLAGLLPESPDGGSNTNWFAKNQSGLLTGAKSFCELQAGGKSLPVRVVTANLGVEDHIEWHLRYPAASERPLRFNLAGLRTLTGQGQYGVALTVLDMVNGKVLGQPVVFADAPTLTAELPAPTETKMISPDSAATAVINTNNIVPQPNSPRSSNTGPKLAGSLILLTLVSGIAALFLLAMVRRRHRR